MMTFPPATTLLLPAQFAWLNAYEWSPHTCFEGYKRLRMDVLNNQHLLLSKKTSHCLLSSLSSWANALFIHLFDDENFMKTFVHIYPEDYFNDTLELELFLNFTLIARREAVLGMFSHDFIYYWESQVVPEKQWPCKWYGHHLENGYVLQVPAMHTYTVSYLLDYHDETFSTERLILLACFQALELKQTKERIAAVIDLAVCMKKEIHEKVAYITERMVEIGDCENNWRICARHFVSKYINNDANVSLYTNTMIHLHLATQGLILTSNGHHPCLKVSMGTLEKSFLTRRSPQERTGVQLHCRTLGWNVLFNANLLPADLRFLSHMKSIDIEPWDAYYALISEALSPSHVDGLSDIAI